MHINAYTSSSKTIFWNKGKNKRCVRRQNTAYLAKNIHFLCSLADGRGVYTKKRQESQPTGADHSPPAQTGSDQSRPAQIANRKSQIAGRPAEDGQTDTESVGSCDLSGGYCCDGDYVFPDPASRRLCRKSFDDDHGCLVPGLHFRHLPDAGKRSECIGHQSPSPLTHHIAFAWRCAVRQRQTINRK